MDILITIFLVLVGIGIGFWLRQKVGPQGASLKCQHCGSTSLVEINRETINTRTIEQHGGGLGGGGDIRLQTEADVTYHCSNCNQTTTVKQRRTN